MSPVIECARCHRRRPHKARGLCNACANTAFQNGSLHDYPRTTWSRDDLLDEWDMLRTEGYAVRQAADRLGISLSAFRKALERARRDGDPRAQAQVTR